MLNRESASLEIINKANELGCRCLEKEPLKNHVSFKVGGECRALICVNSSACVAELVRLCESSDMPYLVLGKGSNMLIDDSGFDGIVFLLGKDFSKIQLIDENTIECEAGTPLAKVAYFAYKNGLTGLEFSWGIPGTVGGAVYMNAGAYGGEIKDVIVSAEFADQKGSLGSFSKDELELGYRHSIFHDFGCVITKAIFRLEKGDKVKIRERMDELMARRKEKQPLEYPSAGSTFKRPVGSYAALLIDQCGLKGMCVGGAEVSTKHSGFVINKGDATFSDIIQLIEKVKGIVFEKTGYALECEVEIISPADKREDI